MGQFQFPAPLSEKRSDEREVFTLVNALRRALLLLTAGGDAGFALFSTAIGRGDGLTSTGAELIGINFYLPVAYDTFAVNLSGTAQDSGSAGTLRLRMGGTYGLVDGAVILTLPVGSTGFQEVAGQANVTGNTETLMKMTVQASPGHILNFKGGFLRGG